MRVEFLLLADRAEAIGGKLYLMGGGFDRVGMMVLPGTAQFDVAVGVLVGYNETNLQHSFEIRCEDADSNLVFPSTQGVIEVGRPPGMSAGSEQRAMIVLRGPFPFQVVGEYSWVAVLNGERQQRTSFRVERAQMLAPVPPPTP